MKSKSKEPRLAEAEQRAIRRIADRLGKSGRAAVLAEYDAALNRVKPARGRPEVVDGADQYRIWVSVEALRRFRGLSTPQALRYLSRLPGASEPGSKLSVSYKRLYQLLKEVADAMDRDPQVRALFEENFDRLFKLWIDPKLMAAIPLRSLGN